jgi:hypothetical protein
MVEVFGADLLEVMYKDVLHRFTESGTEFCAEVLLKIIRIAKVCYFLLHLFGVKGKKKKKLIASLSCCSVY